MIDILHFRYELWPSLWLGFFLTSLISNFVVTIWHFVTVHRKLYHKVLHAICRKKKIWEKLCASLPVFNIHRKAVVYKLKIYVFDFTKSFSRIFVDFLRVLEFAWAKHLASSKKLQSKDGIPLKRLVWIWIRILQGKLLQK